MKAFKIKISWWSEGEQKRLYNTINVDAEDSEDAEIKLDEITDEHFDYDIESID